LAPDVSFRPSGELLVEQVQRLLRLGARDRELVRRRAGHARGADADDRQDGDPQHHHEAPSPEGEPAEPVQEGGHSSTPTWENNGMDDEN
jgi:hypothetical protein